MTQVTRVGIVEDEALMRGMLEQTLGSADGIRVVHSVPGVTEARLVCTTVQDEAARPWSYLSKRSSFARDVLVRAVVATAQGQVVLDPYLVQRSTPRAGSAVSELTPAQFGVLRLVAEGLSNRAAGERLGINERSVESHLKAIYQRLGISGDGHNRRVAAVLAFLEQTGRSWRA